MVKQPGLADTSVASSTMSLEGSKQAEAELEPVVVELSSGRKWSLLAILCFAQFMDIVSFAGVLTIASRIAADLHVSSANVTWVSGRFERSCNLTVALDLDSVRNVILLVPPFLRQGV